MLEGRFGARRGQRRGAQRAHPRRPLARGRRAPGDARGGRRGHPRALAGRPAQPPRPPLHGRERAHLRPARAAAAGARLGLRPQGDPARRAHRRRLLHHVARQGGDRPLSLRGRQGPGPRRHQGLLHGRRGRGPRDRASAVAQRGAAGRAGAGPARPPRTSSRRASS